MSNLEKKKETKVDLLNVVNDFDDLMLNRDDLIIKKCRQVRDLKRKLCIAEEMYSDYKSAYRFSIFCNIILVCFCTLILVCLWRS